ncbi:hypothetical protein G7B40_031860 [Aetokthonos hydrillicola Thurmond2011]|jgi:hypothetical protein|uniref:Uncharacterized protein n=1 Tax=Aetokthonos hydrillicola Thurmond2011 TaxID=2712845 RepID=A0AAP5ICP8_9CYAN|nr:hypothetical protein [Aetokthonos hydrillicola]MBO3461289.1 hypothetical protein [Aetokthonos hydrillicola CCALA 1050]MBW4589628.1 hypothetical protein [Aetokthonos hydrillicola CCALA 1050]MDR9899123.1 hypothetical protein [Aetokthonos hydrillicola Thurmond2011]
MFLDELTPIFKEFIQHPGSFAGGFFSGILRLHLSDEPVKSWLDKQTGSTNQTTFTTNAHNGRSDGPQSISID